LNEKTQITISSGKDTMEYAFSTTGKEKEKKSQVQWLILVILAIQEVELSRNVVPTRPETLQDLISINKNCAPLWVPFLPAMQSKT
jgi:hypothetical protein